MFDLGWQEMFLIAVVAIIVVGPKDLPQALRAVTHFVRKARGLAREFQHGIDELVREAELDDIKRQVNNAGKLGYADDLKKAIDPAGSLTEDFDPRRFAQDLKQRVEGPEPDRRAEAKRPQGGGEGRRSDPPRIESNGELSPPEQDRAAADSGDDASAAPAPNPRS